MRNGSEHTAADQFCADRGVFVVENMVNLKAIIGKEATIYTFPLNFAGLTGLPCRVLAECVRRRCLCERYYFLYAFGVMPKARLT